jgi:hypothetical protein
VDHDRDSRGQPVGDARQGHSHVEDPRIEIPREPRHFEELSKKQPRYWELFYLAGSLLQHKERLEPKWLDHSAGFARGGAAELDSLETIIALADASSRVTEAVAQISREFDPKALQQSTSCSVEQRDPRRVIEVAQHLATAYESMLDTAAELRGLRAPAEMRELVEIGARRLDLPIAEVRTYIDDLAHEVGDMPAQLPLGHDVEVNTTLRLSNSDLAWAAYTAALAQLRDRVT